MLVINKLVASLIVVIFIIVVFVMVIFVLVVFVIVHCRNMHNIASHGATAAEAEALIFSSALASTLKYSKNKITMSGNTVLDLFATASETGKSLLKIERLVCRYT